MAPRKRKAAQDGGSKIKKVAKPSSDLEITRYIAKDEPQQAVFHTAELLENILLCLPAKNIFGVQRVSRQFRDLVANSLPIQRKLFLKPTEVERQSWALHWTQQETALSNQPPDHFVMWSNRLSDDERKWTPARLNPLLHLKDGASTNSVAARVWKRGGDKVSTAFEIQPDALGSWRNTLLTNPPTACVGASLHVSAENQSKRSGRGIHLPVRDYTGGGLTLGDVIDAAVTTRGEGFVRMAVRLELMEDMGLHITIQVMLDPTMQPTEETACKLAKNYTLWMDLNLDGIVIPSEEEWESVKGSWRLKNKQIYFEPGLKNC